MLPCAFAWLLVMGADMELMLFYQHAHILAIGVNAPHVISTMLFGPCLTFVSVAVLRVRSSFLLVVYQLNSPVVPLLLLPGHLSQGLYIVMDVTLDRTLLVSPQQCCANGVGNVLVHNT